MAEQTTHTLVKIAMRELFKDTLRITIKDPPRFFFILKTMKEQRKAARLRDRWREKGIQVPPFAILSITNRCNLTCKGCYSQEHHSKTLASEMTDDKLRKVLIEAQELGISIILLAGGEPLLRPGIFDIVKDFRKIIFPFFTNGLLLDAKKVKVLKSQPNVVPVLSCEGYQSETDERRGPGVYENLLKSFKLLQSQNIFFGTSLTITNKNYQTITDPKFVSQFIHAGCKLFFFVEYIPVQKGTEDLVLTGFQRSEISNLMALFRTKYPALFIAFPGDEEKFGGCLAAGRGFIHINPQGNVEPCPFAPFSDANLENQSLKETLQSNLLKLIRQNSDILNESQGGCTLWAKREWIRSLITTCQKDIE